MEHIIYTKPDELIGKEIGFYVQNNLLQGSAKEVKAQVTVLNRHGVIIWPEESKEPGPQDWLKCPN